MTTRVIKHLLLAVGYSLIGILVAIVIAAIIYLEGRF